MSQALTDQCPNCRAPSQIIAILLFIGRRPDPTQGQPNLLPQEFSAGNLAGSVELTAILTPRSMATDNDFNTPGTLASDTDGAVEVALPADLADVATALPTFPLSVEDATAWERTSSMTITGPAPNTVRLGTPVGQSPSQSYISNTELSNGQQALLIDPGSWNNLSGEPRARRTAVLASRHRLRAKQSRPERPLNVSGVGQDARL